MKWSWDAAVVSFLNYFSLIKNYYNRRAMFAIVRWRRARRGFPSAVAVNCSGSGRISHAARQTAIKRAEVGAFSGSHAKARDKRCPVGRLSASRLAWRGALLLAPNEARWTTKCSATSWQYVETTLHCANINTTVRAHNIVRATGCTPQC